MYVHPRLGALIGLARLTLAFLAGISQQRLSRLKQGLGSPTLVTLHKLA